MPWSYNMFVGHLAVALAARKAEPSLPLGASVAAAFGVDLLWPVLLLTGIEVVRVSPHDTAFTGLAFESYPWSHSLLMVLVWSVLAGLVAKGLLGSTRNAVIVGALVTSHWVLDAVTHRPDLPLWPGGPLVGLGLWGSVPATIAVEGALLVIGIFFYMQTTSPKDRIGSLGFYGLVLLCAAMWISQPWAPPPPSATAVALGSLVLWLFVPWSQWVDNHRVVRRAA